MARLTMDEAQERIKQLGGRLIEARLLAGLFSSSDSKKEQRFRRIEELLCEAIKQYDDLEIEEEKATHGS